MYYTRESQTTYDCQCSHIACINTSIYVFLFTKCPPLVSAKEAHSLCAGHYIQKISQFLYKALILSGPTPHIFNVPLLNDGLYMGFVNKEKIIKKLPSHSTTNKLSAELNPCFEPINHQYLILRYQLCVCLPQKILLYFPPALFFS